MNDLPNTLINQPLERNQTYTKFLTLPSKRIETYDKEKNPNGRWRKYSAKEFLDVDPVNLDVTWMTEAKSEEETLTMDEVFKRMEERVKIIQEAFDKLKKELRHEL